MSKKHFVALAAALKQAKASQDVCSAVAGVCARSNINFNWSRFMEACGYE